MSPSAHLARRAGARGVTWQVRFRWAPTDDHARYFATFETKKGAEHARAWVLTEIGHGRYPDRARYFEPRSKGPEGPTLFEVHDAWAKDREAQVGDSAQRMARYSRATYGALGDKQPEQVTVADCKAWVRDRVAEGKKRATISAYRSVLRAVLDEADLPHPNPARDPRVKLPKLSEEEKDEAAEDPPSFRQFIDIAAVIADKHHAALFVLERTGTRIGELRRLTWGDVDWNNDLLRVRRGKTKRSRRWVPMLDEVRAILEAVPHDLRDPKAAIFPDITQSSMAGAMALACTKAGVPLFSPHDLRHRYTSLLVMGGVPPPLVANIVGHEKTSVTLDTYSHVLMDEPHDRLRRLVQAAFTVPSAKSLSVYSVSSSPEQAVSKEENA